MLVREIAYTNRFLGDYKPLNIIENQENALTDLLQIAESVELESEVEELHKGVYQDNYYMERYGVKYVIQHDIVCDYLILYEVVKEM